MNKIIKTIASLALVTSLVACSSSSSQQTTSPSGSNGTTHGAPKSGMKSGSDSALRQ